MAVTGVPLAAVALVLEVFFGKAFGPPAIIACGVTYLLTLRIEICENPSPSPVRDARG